MENSSIDVQNRSNKGNMILELPTDTDLDKLRSCNIIPKGQADFQRFVIGLTGDTVSDSVVQEVWRQIFKNESTDVAKPTSAVLETESQASKPKRSRRNMTNDRKSIAVRLPDSKKVEKRRHSLHAVVKISKLAEESQGTERQKTVVTNGGGCADTVPTLSELKLPVTEQNVAIPESSDSCSEKMAKKRSLSCPVTIFPKQEKISSSASGNGNVTIAVNENKSRDCEIIGVITKVNGVSVKDDSGSESNNSDLECVDSSSDSSVEILESLSSIKPLDKSREEHVCPVHGTNSLSSPQVSRKWSTSGRENSYYVQTDEQMNTSNDTSQGQQKVKRRKNEKYNMLRNEVKCLKSLLVNVLMSLKNNSVNECQKQTEIIPSTSKENLINKPSRNFQKSENDNCSFSRKKWNKEKPESKRNVTSAELKNNKFVEMNKSTKTTKAYQTRQKTTKYSKDCDEIFDPLDKTLDAGSCASGNESGRRKFLWRNVISDTLKSMPGMQLPVEKLKRIVIAKYYYNRGNVSQNTSVKFFRYLHSTANVVVDGDMAIFTKEQIIKISSKSEQKKQFITKTITTTKEYKMT